jgi:hypothetical protein
VTNAPAGPDTFIPDVLFRPGADDLRPPGPAPYPRYDLADLADLVDLVDLRSLNPDLVVMSDDPYPFSPTVGPGSWPGRPRAPSSPAVVSPGTPSPVRAPEVLGRQLKDNRVATGADN